MKNSKLIYEGNISSFEIGQILGKSKKYKFEFLGKKFEIEQSKVSKDFIMGLTGLMVCGKEYYNLLKSLNCRVGDNKFWKHIKNHFEEDLKDDNLGN